MSTPDLLSVLVERKDAARQERERIIQVLLRTDPVTVEDRNHQGNPFSQAFLKFDEASLRAALEPKP